MSYNFRTLNIVLLYYKMFGWGAKEQPVNCEELVKEMNECVKKDKEDPKCLELLEKVEKECKKEKE